MCIFKASLSNLRDAWAKYKEDVLDVSDSDQNVERNRKTKRWIMYVCS